MNPSQKQSAAGLSQEVKNWNTAAGLPRAIEDWRTARRECKLRSTSETVGRYCTATDLLARALLGDLAAEPESQAIFERFYAWLIDEEDGSRLSVG
jgi:hypothetical protein